MTMYTIELWTDEDGELTTIDGVADGDVMPHMSAIRHLRAALTDQLGPFPMAPDKSLGLGILDKDGDLFGYYLRSDRPDDNDIVA